MVEPEKLSALQQMESDKHFDKQYDPQEGNELVHL